VFAHVGVASDRHMVADAVPVDYSMPLGRVFARMSMYVDNLLNRAKRDVAPASFLEQNGILGVVGHAAGVVAHISVVLPISATLDLKGKVRYQDTVSKI